MTSRIILVEDNLSDIELIRIAFEEAAVSAEFIIFRDGEEAISEIRRIARSNHQLPDLVFLDLNLPRASGHEVLAVIRAEPLFASLPVLVLSTSNHPVDRSRCIAAGASDYLVKPSRFDELLSLVHQVVRQWLTKPL